MLNQLYNKFVGSEVHTSKLGAQGKEGKDIKSLQLNIYANDLFVGMLAANEVISVDKMKYEKLKGNVICLSTTVNGISCLKVLGSLFQNYWNRLDDKKVVIRREPKDSVISLIFNRCIITSNGNKICQRIGVTPEPFKMEVKFNMASDSTVFNELILRLQQIPVRISTI